MKVAIPAEADSEPRVAATPDTVKKLKAYADVVVQSGAGLASGLLDSDYEAAGATIAQSAADTVQRCRRGVKGAPPRGGRARELQAGCAGARDHGPVWR